MNPWYSPNRASALSESSILRCYRARVIVDTHCHLTHDKLSGETQALLLRAEQADVRVCVTIGTGVDDGRAVRALMEAEGPRVRGTVGLDPFTAHAAGAGFEAQLGELTELLDGADFCGLGEIGLDYHYDLGSPAEQRRRFEPQLRMAADRRLPVVIHVREAHQDMAAVLADHPTVGGVIHSFTAGPSQAERYLELGWYLGFNGVLTFKNAPEVRDAARLAPADRIVVETDSPYLAPVPHRGKRCEPAFVADTLAVLAQCRGEAVAELAATTSANAARLFGWEPIDSGGKA